MALGHSFQMRVLWILCVGSWWLVANESLSIFVNNCLSTIQRYNNKIYSNVDILWAKRSQQQLYESYYMYDTLLE